MVTEGEVMLVRLPPGLSEVINGAITAFVEEHEAEGLQAYYRWQNADLWMVYKEQPDWLKTDGQRQPGILQVRVTVGAFAGESQFEPELVFMPDNLFMTSQGRLVLPPEVRQGGRSVLSLAGYDPQSVRPLAPLIRAQLQTSWDKALDFFKYPEQLSILLP